MATAPRCNHESNAELRDAFAVDTACLGLVCLRHGCSCWTATLLRGVAVMVPATQGTVHADGAAAVHHRQNVLWSPHFGTKTVDSGELRRGQMHALQLAGHGHETDGREESLRRAQNLSQWAAGHAVRGAHWPRIIATVRATISHAR